MERKINHVAAKSAAKELFFNSLCELAIDLTQKLHLFTASCSRTPTIALYVCVCAAFKFIRFR